MTYCPFWMHSLVASINPKAKAVIWWHPRPIAETFASSVIVYPPVYFYKCLDLQLSLFCDYKSFMKLLVCWNKVLEWPESVFPDSPQNKLPLLGWEVRPVSCVLIFLVVNLMIMYCSRDRFLLLFGWFSIHTSHWTLYVPSSVKNSLLTLKYPHIFLWLSLLSHPLIISQDPAVKV